MSAARHTPGPWVVRPGVCRNDHPDTSADVHGPQGQFVADCGCHEHATANAKLIAVAPALADALEQAAKYLRGGAPVEMALDAIDAALRAAGRLP